MRPERPLTRARRPPTRTVHIRGLYGQDILVLTLGYRAWLAALRCQVRDARRLSSLRERVAERFRDRLTLPGQRGQVD